MGNNMTEPPAYSLREVETVLPVSAKTVRNWLDRRLVYLNANEDRKDGSWRRFTELDAFRLVSIGLMVAYGVPVSLASRILEGELMSIAAEMGLDPRGATLEDLLHGLEGRELRLLVSGSADEDQKWKVITRDENFDDYWPVHFTTIRLHLVASRLLSALTNNRRRLGTRN